MMRRLCLMIEQSFSYHIRAPFDLKYLRQPQLLPMTKKSLESRFRDVKIIDDVVAMLEKYRVDLYELEQLNKCLNKLQKQMKELKKPLSPQKPQRTTPLNQKQILSRISQTKQTQKQKQCELKELVKSIENNILKIGNLVDPISPVSQDEANNVVIKKYEPTNGLLQHSVSYSEICEKFGITDLKRGQKVGGHRGYFLKNGAVKLALALANYGLNFLQTKGYQIYQSPAIITESILKGSCQLQSIQQDTYKLEGSDSYLIATSEQSLAGLYKDQVLSKTKLPIRMAGYSTCFRKEAGAHGKDIHGLFRVHQFEKVQQFTIVQPEQSLEQMKKMIQISQQFYESLEIPYRVVNIVSGELNDAAACKYDLQGWYPSQKKYRELVSVSNCTQYQSRLLKIQYQSQNNTSRYPHMLNGTLVAIQRAITCIVENNYNEDHIKIPKKLQQYTGIDKILIPTINPTSNLSSNSSSSSN